MYSGFKFKKDQADKLAQERKVKPLHERNPSLAKQKMMILSENAKVRREQFINKCDLEADQFKILSNGGNDSMAFKTSFYDFRGEKGRNKNLDVSSERFNTTSYMTTQERIVKAEQKHKAGLFNERDHAKEEKINQRMRPKPIVATSPLGMQLSPRSEIHRVAQVLTQNRRFEPEFFNASRLIQPDVFRIEKRGQSHKWVDKNKRFIVSNSPGTRNINFMSTNNVQLKQVSTVRSKNVNYDSLEQNNFEQTSLSYQHQPSQTLPTSMNTTGFNMSNLKLKLNSLSKEYEPYSKLNQTSSRMSNNKQQMQCASPMALTQNSGRSPFSSIQHYGITSGQSSVTGQYKQVRMVNEKDVAIHSSQHQRSPQMNYNRLINKRGSQPINEHNNLSSNRFFDTFTKLQTLNADLEFSQMPKFGARQNGYRSKEGSPVNKRRSQAVTNRDSDNSKPQLATSEEKLFTIEEFLKHNEKPKKTYFQLADVRQTHKTDRNYNNLSFQQRTQNVVATNDQWKGYVNHMNQDFFDQNKLYLKSVADYKSRFYKKPQDDDINYTLPDINKVKKPQSNIKIVPDSNHQQSIMSEQGLLSNEDVDDTILSPEKNHTLSMASPAPHLRQ